MSMACSDGPYDVYVVMRTSGSGLRISQFTNEINFSATKSTMIFFRRFNTELVYRPFQAS